eukprot:GHVN01062331.1.p3 GENE.GHVN01062331.1~~GHVN01062331.1.p3  ORF type:complete len:124 (+),score=17.24 GHVN01062331.1:1139-1510(+)
MSESNKKTTFAEAIKYVNVAITHTQHARIFLTREKAAQLNIIGLQVALKLAQFKQVIEEIFRIAPYIPWGANVGPVPGVDESEDDNALANAAKTKLKETCGSGVNKKTFERGWRSLTSTGTAG